jgi:hypothetical protein
MEVVSLPLHELYRRNRPECPFVKRMGGNHSCWDMVVKEIFYPYQEINPHLFNL